MDKLTFKESWNKAFADYEDAAEEIGLPFSLANEGATQYAGRVTSDYLAHRIDAAKDRLKGN